MEQFEKLRELHHFTEMEHFKSGKNTIYSIPIYNDIQYLRRYIILYLNNDIFLLPSSTEDQCVTVRVCVCLLV